MPSVTRLVQRGGVFYFRMAVPRHLVASLKRSEVKVSLRTSDRMAAKVRSRLLSNAFDTLFEEMKTMPQVTPAMIEARKCRAADDLLMVIETMPALKAQRSGLADLLNPQLRLIALGTGGLHERALAVAYLTGTDVKPSRHLLPRRGEPALAFDLLDELAAPLIAVVLSNHRCGPNSSSNTSPNHASNTSNSASVVGTGSGQSSVTVHALTSCLGRRPMRDQGIGSM